MLEPLPKLEFEPLDFTLEPLPAIEWEPIPALAPLELPGLPDLPGLKQIRTDPHTYTRTLRVQLRPRP